MATKTSDYEKFKAVQANNEAIAKQDFAGLTRGEDGWYPKSPSVKAVLGGKPLMQAGGRGASVLDMAMNEPVPKTIGQKVLKAAGQWKQLTDYYANSAASAAQVSAQGVQEPTQQEIAQRVQDVASNTRQGISAAMNKREINRRVKAAVSGTQQAVSEAMRKGLPSASNQGNVIVTDERLQEEQAARGASIPVESTAKPKTYNVNGRQMTLGEYIKSMGVDPEAQYRQSVAAANAGYDRSRATYGAEAEALASAGLAGSGTSDYADQQAYAAQQKAISDASQLKTQQEAALGAQYMSYLQQEQAQYDAKVQSAIDRAAAMQLNEANTVKYLMAMTGMTKSEAEGYAKGGAVLIEETSEEDKTAKLQEITESYLNFVKSADNGGWGMSSDAAIEYLKRETMGYDAELVDQAVNDLLAMQTSTAEEAKATAQKEVGEVFDQIWDEAYTNEEIISTLSKAGITLKQDEDGAIYYGDVNSALVSAYKKGLITEEDYLRLEKKNVDDAVKKAKKSISDLLDVVHEYKEDAQMQKYAMEKIKGDFSAKKTFEDELAEDSMNTINPFSMSNKAYYTISFNGKDQRAMFNLGAAWDEKKNGKEPSAKSEGEIVVKGGKAYVYKPSLTGSKWREIKSIESNGYEAPFSIAGSINKQEADALLKVLIQKYSK